jgi:hypothetical protein
MDVVAYIQSRHKPGGVVVLATSVARPTQLMVPTRGLHDAMVSTRSAPEAAQAFDSVGLSANHDPI